MAFAYRQLGDNDMCIKYHEKNTKKGNNDMCNYLIFSKQQQTIMEHSYQYEADDTISLLPRLFHSLNEKIRETDNFERSEVLDMADSFFQCGLLYKQKKFFLESTNAYISALSLYMSKSLTDTDELINDINKLLKVFINGDLDCEDLIKVCERHLTSNMVELMRIKVASLYRENAIYDVKDLDGDNDTSNESRNIALQQYRDLLEKTDEIMIKSVCYFNILNLYKNYIFEDDDGKHVVENMLSVLPKFTISDRRLLVKLAIHFMAEYDNNKGACDININRRLQKMEKNYFDEKLEIDKDKCIGQYLIDCDDFDGAEEYWNSIAEQIKNHIPHWILSLVCDPDSIFDDILQTINQPENDSILLLNQLASTYESLGTYYMLDAKNGQTTGTNCFQQAETMYNNAVHLLNRIKADSGKIREVEMKRQEAALSITTNVK